MIIADDAIIGLDDFFFNEKITYYPFSAIDNALLRASQADTLLVRSRTKIDAKLLKGTSINFIGSTVAGLDHIDQTCLQDIQLACAAGCNAQSVAEYVITNILDYAVQHGKCLRTLTLGIVGVGAVGSHVAQAANTLGIQTLLCDPPRAETETFNQFCDLSTCLQADIVSLHTPLNSAGKHATYHLLNQDNLKTSSAKMLIQAARGKVVDEAALLQKSWQYLAIDCWESEPHVYAQLAMKSTIATPHIAGHSFEGKWQGTAHVAKHWHAYKNIPYTPPQIPLNQSTLSIDISTFDSIEAALLAVMQQVYNPKNDDFRSNTADLATSFEHKRATYPQRLQWCNAFIQLHNINQVPWGTTLQKHLNKLGFKSQVQSSFSQQLNRTTGSKITMKGGC